MGRGDYVHTPYADRGSIRRNGALVRMSGLYDFTRQDLREVMLARRDALSLGGDILALL